MEVNRAEKVHMKQIRNIPNTPLVLRGISLVLLVELEMETLLLSMLYFGWWNQREERL
jgi:hypothetical protein